MLNKINKKYNLGFIPVIVKNEKQLCELFNFHKDEKQLIVFGDDKVILVKTD